MHEGRDDADGVVERKANRLLRVIHLGMLRKDVRRHLRTRLLVEAERAQGRHGVRDDALLLRRKARAECLRLEHRDLVAQFHANLLGSLLAHALHGGKALRVARGDAHRKLTDGSPGENRQRDLRSDARNGRQLEEHLLLVGRREPEQHLVVLADDVRHQDLRLGTLAR